MTTRTVICLALLLTCMPVAGGRSRPNDGAVPDLPLVESVSQYGITWRFDRSVPVGRFVNGDYYVAGPVTVVDIDPRPVLDRSGGTESRERLGANDHMQPRRVKVDVTARNGSMLNLQVAREKTGFDSRAPGNRFAADLFLAPPIRMKPGDSLVSTISADEVRTIPRMLNPSGQKTLSPVRKAAVLTCMDRPVPADAFRPSYCDTSNKVYLARNLRRDLLPSLPRATCTVGMPREDVLYRTGLERWDVTAIDIWPRVFRGPWIDTVTFEFCQPVENRPDYGREIARAAGIATLLLCCDYTAEQKEKLLIPFVQVGIDLWGAVRAGHKGWIACGGHGSGRKWIIVFSGLMLGDAKMRSPNTDYPDVRFSEDMQTAFGSCWTGADVVFAGHSGAEGKGDRGLYEHLPPSEWPGMTGEAYRRCCTSSAWVAQALAARILHAEAMWDHDAFFAYVDRWMTEDDTEHRKIIKEATGREFSAPAFHQRRSWDPFVNEMWAVYRDNLPPRQGP